MALDFDTIVAALVSAVREMQEQSLIPSSDDFVSIVESLERIADALENR